MNPQNRSRFRDWLKVGHGLRSGVECLRDWTRSFEIEFTTPAQFWEPSKSNSMPEDQGMVSAVALIMLQTEPEKWCQLSGAKASARGFRGRLFLHPEGQFDQPVKGGLTAAIVPVFSYQGMTQICDDVRLGERALAEGSAIDASGRREPGQFSAPPKTIVVHYSFSSCEEELNGFDEGPWGCWTTHLGSTLVFALSNRGSRSQQHAIRGLGLDHCPRVLEVHAKRVCW
ncbi:uncharacterized protein BJX67DRAFT_308789 [Aspergillus lucknowensis]|uniref:Uncharacterized protein n=1 Tax=Aspergillus lucknowensis TaxID=176173 RepID=A0ABR4M0D2_9EURO